MIGILALCGVFASNVIGNDEPVSFKRDVQPILSRSCAGCHRPEKSKGKLDLATYAALSHGGKSGAAFTAGKPDASLLIQQVSGDEPEMPSKGEKLTATEVGLLSRWIGQGAKDDSAIAASETTADLAVPKYPMVYPVAPVISAIAISPDGSLLAVAGCYEVLLHEADGSKLIARMPASSPHITSLCFSSDGSRLVAGGGSAGEFGKIDVFDMAGRKPSHSFSVSTDTLFGLSLSPSGELAAVGCADRSSRVISLSDGKEVEHFSSQSDWVLCTVFSLDGTRVVTGGRDKNLWVFDLPTHRPVDPINDPNESIISVARNPKQDVVICGAASGVVRMYRLTDLQKGTEQNREPNRIREMDRQPGSANAIVYSPDGATVAIASTGETRLYTSDGNRRISTCAGSGGGVYAVAFSADGKKLYTGGFDGHLRIFGAEKGEVLKDFIPVPLKENALSAEHPVP